MSCVQRAVAQQIHARVADLADEVARAGDQQHRRRRAHALLVDFGDRAVVDRAVRLAQRVRDELRRRRSSSRSRTPAQLALDDLHGHLARDFARRVAAHAVGDDEEPRVAAGIDGEVVFVAGADHADVRPRGVEQTLHERPSARRTPPRRSAMTDDDPDPARHAAAASARAPAPAAAALRRRGAGAAAPLRRSIAGDRARSLRLQLRGTAAPAAVNLIFTPPNRRSGEPSSRRSSSMRVPPT